MGASCQRKFNGVDTDHINTRYLIVQGKKIAEKTSTLPHKGYRFLFFHEITDESHGRL